MDYSVIAWAADVCVDLSDSESYEFKCSENTWYLFTYLDTLHCDTDNYTIEILNGCYNMIQNAIWVEVKC